VQREARQAWLAQRDGDNGCAAMAQSLYDAGQFDEADAWHKARVATDINRPRAVRQALMLIGPEALGRYEQLSDNPARYLARKASTRNRSESELTTLALERLAATDPEAAAFQLDDRWSARLPPDLSSWAWASTARQAAIRLLPQAADYYQRATRGAEESKWPDDSLAWKARASLRAGRWQQAAQAINAMSLADQLDPTWVYWKARALQAIAADSQESATLQQEARELLGSIADQYNFYGQLAAEDLGRPQSLPPRAVPLNSTEKAAARDNPGFTRSLKLIALGLRNEGVREWNWTLAHGPNGRMGDRELLAAAQVACDQQVWDRCINTSDRTTREFDFDQRFPMPFRREVVQRSREIGLDPAYVYGLIRQESRFIMDARSGVGASGLMQLMPGTARWTARRIGMTYSADMITDRDTNIALGTAYLKLALDDMGGSQALAAAAYNAGPRRPRRWREGPILEAPIWVENIPFTETRDYVKKVLSNATYYAAILNGGQGKPATLKSRVGTAIGPRPVDAPPEQTDLP
jgi:soluble lytic murein transglycosylase